MLVRTRIKKLLDVCLHPLGFNIERYFGDELALKGLVKLAGEHQIDLLLDVGANTGQFALKMIEAGYRKNIISFEPLTTAHEQLQKNAQHHPQWSVFSRCAIGNTDGMIDINISANSHSSSILEVTSLHTDAAPEAAFIHKETTPIKKLDTHLGDFNGYNNILLKIDTQGFEQHVLAGAENLLKQKVKIIQLEMSLLPLYEGVMPFEDMVPYLAERNFRPAFYSPGYIDRNTGQIQQLEGYFIKY